MSGEKRNNVTVKMNGEFWEGKPNKATMQAAEKETSSRVRLEPPSLPFSVTNKVPKEDDAWDRMKQLRGTVVHESARKMDAPQETGDLPEEEMTGLGKRAARFAFPSLPKGPFFRTALTTVGAVAIGLVFGMLVLSLFSQEDFSKSYRSVLSETVQTMTAQGTDQKEGDLTAAGSLQPNETANQPAGTPGRGQTDVALELPAVKMFVAQAGVFQPGAPAQTAVEPLDKLGLPHLLYIDSTKQYMFAAAAPTRDAVLGFASSLKNKGIDVYVKEFSFPAFEGTVSVGRTAGAADSPDLGAFFSNGVKLAQTLSADSGMIITNQQPTLSQEGAAALKEQHRQFLEESRLVQVSDQWQPLFSGMVNGINQAIAARDKMAEASAGKKADSAESYAWQVQAGVLGYLENYAKWVQEVQKSE